MDWKAVASSQLPVASGQLSLAVRARPHVLKNANEWGIRPGIEAPRLAPKRRARTWGTFPDAPLNFLQSLHVVDAGDLADAVHNFLEMLEVGDFQDHIHLGLSVLAVGLNVADVGAGVADDGDDLFQHAGAVVADQGEFDGIGNGLAFNVAGPFNVDAAVGFVEKIGDVGAVDGVDGHAFAAGNVADDGFAANRVATAGAIDEQVAVPADDDGVGVSAEDAADHARKTPMPEMPLDPRPVCAPANGLGAGGSEFREHLAGGVLAVAEPAIRSSARPSPYSVATLQFLLDFLERDAVFARLFFQQLAADVDGALALVDVDPVLDLVAGAGRLDDAQPVAAGVPAA